MCCCGSDSPVCSNKLCPMSFALALGLLKGFCMMALAYTAMYCGHGSALVVLLSDCYSGFAATCVGGIYGFAWGFLGGFVFGLVFAMLYNCFISCCRKKKMQCEVKHNVEITKK